VVDLISHISFDEFVVLTKKKLIGAFLATGNFFLLLLSIGRFVTSVG